MLQNLSIEIYDTTLPTWEKVPLEFAKATTLKLEYNGEDAKTNVMLPSVLNLSMEVYIAPPAGVDVANYDTDATFKHLFTGNETRYQVHLRDEDTDKILWRGHLLPEQYSEPYTQNTFYVSFTASDGLARLKEKKLPEGMYRGRSSIAHIIANCLLLTGLNLQFWVSQAIKNTGESGKFEKIETWFYNLSTASDEENKDAYTILEEVLQLMGCVLFQQNDTWYIVGWNQFYKSGIFFDVYSPAGIRFPELGLVSRNNIYLKFLAGVNANITAPFKRVLVESPFKEDIQIFPENIAGQNWRLFQWQQFPSLPEYWRAVGISYPYQIDLIQEVFNIWTDINTSDEPITTVGYVGIFKRATNTVNNYSAWIEQANLQYVLPGMKFKITIELMLQGNTVDQLTNNNVKFSLNVNDSVLYSNRGQGVNVNLTFSDAQAIAESFKSRTAKLEITEFTNIYEGFMALRIYRIQGFNAIAHIAVKDLKIELLDAETVSVVKERDIDFATEFKIAPVVKDSLFWKSASIVVDERRTGYQEVPFIITDNPPLIADTDGILREYSIPVAISPQNVSLVTANIFKLYIRRKDTDFYENITGARIVRPQPTSLGFLYINSRDERRLSAGDKLYINSAHSNVFTPTRIAARQLWQKTELATESTRLHDSLAQVVHDIHPEALIKLEGETEHLVFPLDKLRFRFDGVLRGFMPLRIENTLDKGRSRITVIEDKILNVTNYV